jgi:hypothetical protein
MMEGDDASVRSETDSTSEHEIIAPAPAAAAPQPPPGSPHLVMPPFFLRKSGESVDLVENGEGDVVASLEDARRPMGGSADDDIILPLPSPATGMTRETSIDEESLHSLDVSHSSRSIGVGAVAYHLPSVAALPSKKQTLAGSEQWTLSAEERKGAHNALRVMEAHRRHSYEPKLLTSRAYWISVRELLKAGMEETHHTDVTLRGIVSANESYCGHLQAASQNTFSSKSRSLDVLASSLLNNTIETLNPLSPSRSSSQEVTHVTTNEAANNKKVADSDNPVQAACRAVAHVFSHESTTMKDMILLPLNELKEKMESELGRMQILGDTIHEELQASEAAIQHYWSLYYEAYYKSLSVAREDGNGTSRNNNGSIAPSLNGASSDDVWLSETQYRLAVQAQAESWMKVDPELAKLFSSMKGLEVDRRSTVKELTVMLLQQQNRLFFLLQGAMTPAKDDLARRVIDCSTVEADIKASIHYKSRLVSTAERVAASTAEIKQLEKGAVSSPPRTQVKITSALSIPVSQRKGPQQSTTDAPMSPATEALNSVVITNTEVTNESTEDARTDESSKSPLASALARHARVVKRQTTSTLKRISGGQWKSCLAVVTADAYLHLIDIPLGIVKELTTNDVSVEHVFQALIPPVSVTTEVKSTTSQQAQQRQPAATTTQNRLLSTFGAGNNRPLLHVAPSLSIHLTCCTITFDHDKPENDLLEIVEVQAARGASRLMMQKTRQQRMQIRAGSRVEALDLLYYMDAAQMNLLESTANTRSPQVLEESSVSPPDAPDTKCTR